MIAGIVFPEITTHVFVILGLRTKSFRTFIKWFSTYFKTAVYVSTDMFCVKKFFSSAPDFEPKCSTSFPQKCEKDFKTAFCVSRGKNWGNLLFVLENKKILFDVFLVSSQNLSEILLKLHSKCPEDTFQGKKVA